MPQVLDWKKPADRPDIVRRAARALAAGRVVALPTETVYGLAASALANGAVEALCQGKGRSGQKPLTLAVRDAADALDWVPGMSPLGRRLARRCWPGPVTLVFGEGVEHGLAGRLPEAVRRRVCPEGTLGLRAPAHEAVAETLARLAGPLVLTSANRSGEPPAATAEQVVAAVGDEVDLVIDDGPAYYGQASTVVLVRGDGWSILRQGVVSAEDLERSSARVVVFVCTGNTCRSPLAEALCKKLLADRLGCGVDELPRRGFVVTSAGLAACRGGPAADEAVVAARDLGADLGGHLSRPLTAELAGRADFLVALTRSHMLALADLPLQAPAQVRLLGAGGEDVPDPIGREQEVYHECARQILRHLGPLAAELAPAPGPGADEGGTGG